MRTHDAQTLVLSALADGPLHGYAINAAIEKLAGDRLGAGSLYGALARLEAKRFVEALEGEGRQRPFRLTGRGRQELALQAKSMARVSEHVFESIPPDDVHYLDRVAASDTGRSYKRVVLHALGARPGHTVLDLGCGPGTDLGTLADAVGPAGAVVGVDASREMVERARGRAGERTEGAEGAEASGGSEGAAGVRVLLGDVHRLPLADASVDRARTDRVLQHVTDPAQVLAEARRVLRPGGRLVMAEPDWDSLVVDYPDLHVARAYTRHITDRIVRNGVIGRELPRLAEEAGFEVPMVVPVTSVFRDVGAADVVLGLERNTRRAVVAGYFGEEEGRAWLSALGGAGRFFAAVTLYVVVAQSPAVAV
ncbi:methyltransferase domain-containing protein [Streptomyces sp. NPDC048057]|uniref:methyltransferase domain-containing protein n=1 Tax=Streptomyces sp. NPDC048057 TaxID=3155628 RepID=UPI0033E110E7